MEHLHSSEFWLNHFQENALIDPINWEQNEEISLREKEVLIPSLQVFQLGTTSDGSRLLEAAHKYADRHQDQQYVQVVRLFIQEENKHGDVLRRYLQRVGEVPKTKDLGDTLFRKIRGLNGNMEIWTITALIVESAAQVYFEAVSQTTRCPLLKDVCAHIALDEKEHIRFQRERLSIIYNRKSSWKKAAASFIYHLHFKLTYRAIWLGHAAVFKTGGFTYDRFRRLMHQKFNTSMVHVERETSKRGNSIPVWS